MKLFECTSGLRARGEPVSRLGVPEGIPRAIKISRFAAALGMDVRTVRTWVDEGRLETLPAPPRCTRYVRAEELARFEVDGWPVDWESLI